MDESEVIEFLHKGTLVGLLPVPHPITIRKYRSTRNSGAWLTGTCSGCDHKMCLLRLSPLLLGSSMSLSSALPTHIGAFFARMSAASQVL